MVALLLLRSTRSDLYLFIVRPLLWNCLRTSTCICGRPTHGQLHAWPPWRRPLWVTHGRPGGTRYVRSPVKLGSPVKVTLVVALFGLRCTTAPTVVPAAARAAVRPGYGTDAPLPFISPSP